MPHIHTTWLTYVDRPPRAASECRLPSSPQRQGLRVSGMQGPAAGLLDRAPDHDDHKLSAKL